MIESNCAQNDNNNNGKVIAACCLTKAFIKPKEAKTNSSVHFRGQYSAFAVLFLPAYGGECVETYLCSSRFVHMHILNLRVCFRYFKAIFVVMRLRTVCLHC